jgi:hypothetical protein
MEHSNLHSKTIRETFLLKGILAMQGKELEKWKTACEGARTDLCPKAMDGLTHSCADTHDPIEIACDGARA